MKKLVLLVFILMGYFAIGQTFPGAEGFGADWVFTDDYEVRIVTNLNDSGTGSLRNAITASSTNDGIIVCFNGLSGIIDVNRDIEIQDGKHIYIAGQTSENGIVLRGRDYRGKIFRIAGAENGVIVRGIFFDRDASPWNNGGLDTDCIGIGTSSNVVFPKNVIYDHCTFTGATDENIQFWQTSENITIQNCIIAEPTGDATTGTNLGMLLGADTQYRGPNKVSIYNNYFASNKTRTPSIHRSGADIEFVNNVVYNSISDGAYLYDYGTPAGKNFNWINNHYIDGPETSGPSLHNRPVIGLGTDTNVYSKGNLSYYRQSQTDPEIEAWRIRNGNAPIDASYFSATPHDTPLVDTPITTTQELIDAQANVVGTFARIDKEIAFINQLPTDGQWYENTGGTTGTGTYKYDDNGSTYTPKYVYTPASISAASIITDKNNNGIPDNLEGVWGNDTFGYVNNLASGSGDTSTGSIDANAGSDVSICTGESATLKASGGSTYAWNTGATTQSITVNPNSTQTYTVTVSEGSVSDTDDVIVTVNTVSANAGSDVTIDEGDSISLTASGGDSYSWNTGATTQSITVSPTASRDYSVTVTSNGCDATDTVRVNVNTTIASVTANAGSDVFICTGESATLTASGGSTYAWNTGATTQSITVNPNSTQTYTVTVSEGSVSDTDDVIVTVNTVTADAGSGVIIDQGDSATLKATGGSTYAWSTGETTQSITVTPSSTKSYSVTVSNNGCSSSDEVIVTVNEIDILNPPLAQANAGEDMTICLGQSVVLNGSGGQSYVWSNGETSNTIEVSPTRTSIYELYATRGGVTNSDSVTVTVENCSNGIIDDETLISLELNVFPNPTQGNVEIRVDNLTENSNMQINDMKGSIIYSEDLMNEPSRISRSLDLTRFADGIYLVRLSNSKEMLVKKLIIL